MDVAVAELVQHEPDWWSALRRRRGATGAVDAQTARREGVRKQSGAGEVWEGAVEVVEVGEGWCAASRYSDAWRGRCYLHVQTGADRRRCSSSSGGRGETVQNRRCGDAGRQAATVAECAHAGTMEMLRARCCEMSRDVACGRPGWFEDAQMQADRVKEGALAGAAVQRSAVVVCRRLSVAVVCRCRLYCVPCALRRGRAAARAELAFLAVRAEDPPRRGSKGQVSARPPTCGGDAAVGILVDGHLPKVT